MKTGIKMTHLVNYIHVTDRVSFTSHNHSTVQVKKKGSKEIDGGSDLLYEVISQNFNPYFFTTVNVLM